ncbi:hypothetical protein ANCDUO_01102 [Ancylostoma duodenale]|uniref:Uncharacterized protein n=1 Tax=Ancylostoma duodenale TaxID=51022 RepID=A0A0C2DZS5_9BILA|nr:hypothetical protein ANCDUO_01102 [Ancylostoma duodenale]
MQSKRLNILFRFKAGLRTLHEIGPELKRAISGNLETDFNFEDPEPQHRRTHSLFNNIVNRIAGARSPSDHGDRGLWQIALPAAAVKPGEEPGLFCGLQHLLEL